VHDRLAHALGQQALHEDQEALDGWARLLEEASRSGYEGLRLTGDTSWVGTSDRANFMEYEREVQRLFRKSRMLTICSYPVSGLTPSDIAEAVSSHGASLVKKDGSWTAIWRAGAADDDHELREKERRCTLITELTSELVFRLEIGAAGDLGLEWITGGLSVDSGHTAGDICTLDKLKFVIHPDDRAAFTGSLHKVLAGGQTDTEIRYLAKTGAERWIRVHMIPERYDGTRIIKGVIGRGRDITERKKAQARLLESEKKYRGLYESISDGVMRVGMDGRITDCNQPLVSMLGRSQEELSLLSYTDITPPEMKATEKEILKGRLFQNGFCEYEKEFLTKDGSRVPASVSAWLLKDSEGNAEGFWAFVKDLTESKDAERKILDGENLFNALTLSLPGIFYIVDRNGRILKWNRALEETTEYSRTEIADMRPVDFFDAGEKKTHQREAGAGLQPGRGRSRSRARHKGRPPDTVPLQGSADDNRRRALPHRDRHGHIKVEDG
jgi:PAS domain S-box-containing protein